MLAAGAAGTARCPLDERRTGEDGYRRPVVQAREENPQRPGRPIEPFGYTTAEAKVLVRIGAGVAGTKHREALGDRVRRFTNTGGETSKKPNAALPLGERLRRSAVQLDDADLDDLIDALRQERRRRKRGASASD